MGNFQQVPQSTDKSQVLIVHNPRISCATCNNLTKWNEEPEM